MASSFPRRALSLLFVSAVLFFLVLGVNALVEQFWQYRYSLVSEATSSPWAYSETAEFGGLPTLVARVKTVNHVNDTEALAFFSCGTADGRGVKRSLRFEFIPSRAVSRIDMKDDAGLGELFWRIDTQAGQSLPVELKLLGGDRLHYRATGPGVYALAEGILSGRDRFHLLDGRIPRGGVLEVFGLNGSNITISRVVAGC